MLLLKDIPEGEHHMSRLFEVEDYGTVSYPEHAIWMHLQDQITHLKAGESVRATFRASGTTSLLWVTALEDPNG